MEIFVSHFNVRKAAGKEQIKFTMEEAEWRYSSNLSLVSVLNWDGWSRRRPGRFTPGKETPYPLYRGKG